MFIMDSDDEQLDKQIGQTQAFEVPPMDDFDPMSQPQTGYEYLQQVVYERKNCPEWVSVTIDKSKLKKDQFYYVDQIRGCTDAPVLTKPSMEWQDNAVEGFKSFHRCLLDIKEKNPHKSHSSIFNKDQWIRDIKTMNVHPKIELLFFEEFRKLNMLEYLIASLDETENGDSIHENTGRWIFAILACLEVPPVPDACSLLRTLARKCSDIRHNLFSKSIEEGGHVPLNLFICLVARYFSQSDLADN